MRADDPADAADASWALLEHAIEQLHAAARAGIDAADFYRELLAKGAAALAARGGAAWRVAAQTSKPPTLIVDHGMSAGALGVDFATRRELAARVLESRESLIQAAGPIDVLLAPVVESQATSPGGAQAVACIELWMPADDASAVRQGWLDYATALADVAADFHAFDALRRLRAKKPLGRETIELLQRLEQARSLPEVAYALANEGRRLIACDRLSILVGRGKRLTLAAISGVDSVDARGDFARRIERLALHAAQWGEPLEQGDAAADLPPQLSAAVDQYVDESHARQFACVPIVLVEPTTAENHRASRRAGAAVLIAESFREGSRRAELRDRLVELGELAVPILTRAVEFDRFPTSLAWVASRWLAALFAPVQAFRSLAWAVAIAGVVAGLVFVPVDLDVEAPATLHARIEREVFAPATGTIVEVHVKHGQLVDAGQALATIRDPELSLKRQQIRGEIEALKNRRAALAVTRTDRSFREVSSSIGDRLPLAAEQQQIEKQLASLARQLALLDERMQALTVTSPIAGEILTRDIQSLLENRPVERGQVLLTVADASSGWELDAEVPQRRLGEVLAAAGQSKGSLAVSYRLSADVEATYDGHVTQIAAAAPLDADGLRDEAAPVNIRIAADGAPPPAARPGMNATVRIHCGRASAGYVWLHDAASTIYRWLTF